MAQATDPSHSASSLSISELRTHAEKVHADITVMADAEGILQSEDIHGLRVASKELRALWQLLRPVLDKTQVAQALDNLQQAADLLSSSRDHQVALDTVERLLARSRQRDPRQALLDAQSALQAATPTLPRQRTADLQPFWQRDLQRWQALTSPVDADSLRHTGFARLYRKAAKLAGNARSEDDIRLWHKLRKWVKYLSLTLPLIGRDHALQEITDELTRLGKKLGQLHDLHQLVQRIEQLDWQQSAPEQAAYVKHLIRREEARLCERCSEISGTLFGPSAAQFVRQL